MGRARPRNRSRGLFPRWGSGAAATSSSRGSPRRPRTGWRSRSPLEYHPLAKLAVAFPAERKQRGNIVVATGGTSDMPVAEEAALTAEAMGNQVTRLYDVGVAGLHRLLSNLDVLMRARCVIAVAGMEGRAGLGRRRAGGLPRDRCPHQRGLWGQLRRPVRAAVHAQLLRLRCSVVNIDNGFGPGIWRAGSIRWKVWRIEEMRTLYIECNMGAAGDMLLAALYELLEDKSAF